MNYFHINNLTYDPSILLKNISLSDIEWDTYGPKSKKTIYVHTMSVNDSRLTDIVSKFKSNTIDHIMIFMIKRFGVAMPHIDTRPTSVLLPLKGNFENSFIDFYDRTDLKQISFNREGSNSTAASNAGIFFPTLPPIESINYTTPICINTHIVHSVRNPTDSDRYVISLSVRTDLNFSELKQEFENRNILS